jgi:hypothetical protein
MHARRKKHRSKNKQRGLTRMYLWLALYSMCMEEAIKEIEEQGIKVNGEEMNML